MKRSFILFFLIILIKVSTCFAQNLDSLVQIYPTLSPEEQLLVAGQLCEGYKFTDSEKGFKYCTEFQKMALQSGNDSLLGKAYHDLGIVSYVKGELTEAAEGFKKAAKVRRPLPAGDKYIASIQNVAAVYKNLGEFDSAQVYLLEAVTWAESHQETYPSLIANVYTTLANVLLNRLQFKEAHKALDKGMEFFDSLERPMDKGVTMGTRGLIFGSEGKKDSSLFAYKKARPYFIEAKAKSELATLNNNIATVYLYEQQFDSAYAYFNDALKIGRQINSGSQDHAFYAINTAYPLAEIGNLSQARKLMKEGYEIVEKKPTKPSRKLAYKNWARIENLSGNHKAAYDWSEKYRILNDSMLNEESFEKLTEMQEKYESEKKERELAQQSLANETLTQRNQRNLLLGGILVALILGLAAAGYYRIQQKRKYETLVKDLELRNEKERISRDLHDNVGAQLTSITRKLYSLQFQSEKAGDSGLETQSLEQLEDHVRETMGLLRDTIWAIKQEEISLDKLGDKLRDYLFRYLEGMSKPKWEIEVKGSTVLGPKKALGIFRILQEAIQNTVKHAEADQMNILFETTPKGLSIAFKDTGKGFSWEDSHKEGHYGLQNIQDRAKEMKADLKVNSAPGKGFEMVLEMPN